MKRLGPLVLLTLLAVWLLSPSILGGKVMGGDDALYFTLPLDAQKPASLTRPANSFLYDATYVFHPDQQFVREQLRSGHLPAWTPYQAGGRPLLAAQQSAPLYPLNAPSWVLPYWRSLAYVGALKLILAGLGAFVFCCALGLRRGPAMLGAVAFAFCAYMVSWLSHPHDNLYLLLPWTLWAVERACSRGRPRDALPVAAMVGMSLLGGHPESLVVLSPAYVGWGFYALLRGRGDGPPLGRRAGVLTAGVMLGLAIGAVMVLPLIEALGQSYDTSHGQPRTVLRAMIGFLFPQYWGRPDHVVLEGAPVNYAETIAYVGAMPLLLGLGGLAARRPRGPHLFFAALLAVGLVVVFNLGGPLTSWVVELPGLRMANMNRFLVVIGLALAILAAFGLQAFLDGDRRARLRVLAASAVLGLLPPFIWLVGHLSPFPPKREALRYLPNLDETAVATPEALQLATVVRWSLLVTALLAVLTAVVWRPRSIRWLAAACVMVTALDVVSLSRGYQASIDESLTDPPTPASVALMRRYAGAQRVGAEGESLGPNTAIRYGLRDLRGHELPVVARHQRLFTALGGGGFQRTSVSIATSDSAKVLDAFAVRYVLAPSSVRPPDRSLRPVFTAGAQAVFANRDALPRAWVAYGARAANNQADARTKVRNSTTKALQREPVIEGAPAASGGAPAPTSARIVRDEPQHVALTFTAKRPGWLVLHDTHYPGWRAEVDGREAHIKPANAAFRAIRVPAGRHRVTFDYESGVLRAGGALSLIGLAVLLGSGALVLVPSRRRDALDRNA